MDEKVKAILMKSVTTDDLIYMKRTFSRYKLVQDKTFFDYKLLKAGLERKSIPIANFLLNLGCRVKNPNKEGKFEESPLHLAMNLNDSSIVTKILKNGATIYGKNLDRETALYAGSRGGHNNAVLALLPFIYKDNGNIIKSIEMLLDHNTYSVAVDASGRTPLHLTFYDVEFYEKVQIFDMLISKMSTEVNFTDDQGLSHFHIVCARNDVNKVNDFLKSGVSIDSCVASGQYSGFTGLHFSVLFNQKDVVELLLKHKASVNVKTTNLQTTPLHLACNYVKCCMYFDEYDHMYYNKNFLREDMSKLDFKVDWTSRDRKNQFDIINLLLKYGADENAQDWEQRTPIFYTLCVYGINTNFPVYCTICFEIRRSDMVLEMNNRICRIMQLLISGNANLNACSKNQESMLHLMIKHSSLNYPQQLIELLLSKGADTEIVDNDDLTLLHVAVKLFQRKTMQILLKHKANVNAKTNDLKIPLQLLLENSSGNSSVKQDMMFMLLENGSDYVNLSNRRDENFLKMVNFRQENGCTLLHEAVRKGKICTLQKLLDCGADINVEDSRRNSCICYLQHSHSPWSPPSNDTCLLFCKIFQIIYIHVKKLQALGHFVSQKIEIYCAVLYFMYQQHESLLSMTNNYINLDNIFDNCIEELNRMNVTNINNNTSLYNILFKADAHDLSKFIKNRTLVKILEDQSNFPLYTYLLKLRFEKELLRSSVLVSANVSLSSIIGLNLPDLCCDLIFQYLTDEEIHKLKAAARRIIDCRKRDNDSSSTESLEQLPKRSKIQE